MACGKLFENVLESGRCVLVLTAAALYRVIFFVIFLSASIGPATLACYLYIYATGREPYPEVQPAICMMLISCWAEFSVSFERRFCGDLLEYFKSGYPSIMSFGRFTIHFALYIIAFAELYLEFEQTHSIPEPHKERSHFSTRTYSLSDEVGSPEIREARAIANEPQHVTLFLLSLSYVVFITSRNFHKDLILVVRNLPSVTFSMLNNWLMRIAFAIIHIFANLLYFLPCAAIAYTAKSYKTSGLTTFFQLNFTAGMAGMIAALFELNKPWPQHRGQLPFLFHEHNIFGKNLLAHALVVGILYCFYRPKNHPKVLESSFDSTNMDVLVYCLMVAYTTLHVVKFGIHAVLSLAHEYDNRMIELNNVVVDMVQVQDLGSREGGLSNQGTSRATGDEGMCERCTANAINNNSPTPSTPDANQTSDNGCGHSEAGSGADATAEGNASLAENESKVKPEKFKDSGNNSETSEAGTSEK